MDEQIDWLTVPRQLFPLLAGSERSVTVTAWDWAAAGLTVRVLRGRKMRTVQAMFDETAAALQFPYYFGENGAALTECLSDLSWLAPNRGFVLLLQDSLAVLEAESKGSLGELIAIYHDSAQEWAEPSPDSDYSTPIPFTVVLHASPELERQCSDRFTSAGALLGPVWNVREQLKSSE
jgi:hypothetical protein